MSPEGFVPRPGAEKDRFQYSLAWKHYLQIIRLHITLLVPLVGTTRYRRGGEAKLPAVEPKQEGETAPSRENRIPRPKRSRPTVAQRSSRGISSVISNDSCYLHRPKPLVNGTTYSL
ncbi:hypothetical protein J6590_013944 [Homalodisca vitripennis]|nr:hypothetical protein J6590_013944 [Homalodisca vitripennis]